MTNRELFRVSKKRLQISWQRSYRCPKAQSENIGQSQIIWEKWGCRPFRQGN